MYCVVVGQALIKFVCVSCVCVAAYYLCGVCIVWLVDSMIYVGCLDCVVLWRRVGDMIYVMCVGVADLYVCFFKVLLCGGMLYDW